MSNKTLNIELDAIEAATIVTALYKLDKDAQKHANEAAERGDVKFLVGALQAHVICTALLERIEEGAIALMEAEQKEEDALAA